MMHFYYYCILANLEKKTQKKFKFLKKENLRSLQEKNVSFSAKCENTISHCYQKLFDDGLFSDVTFMVENRTLKAHKSLLAATSPVFLAMFENDWRETQLRFGGDVKGIQRKLDYLQGMGVRGIFIAGTPFLNMPWQADSYSPIDFSILDPHWGTIDDWIHFIDDLHARGMYLMMDFTVGTMGDMIGFAGYAPFLSCSAV